MHEYTQSQRFSQECIQYAVEIRVRAERRIGEMLREMAESGARQSGKVPPNRQSSDTTVQSLADLGISKDHASQWQTLASIPEKDFEQWIPALQAEDRLSTRAMMSVAPTGPKTSKENRAKSIAETLAAMTTRLNHTGAALSKIKDVQSEWTRECPEAMSRFLTAVKNLNACLRRF
jgi:hypothetical protein